ncbi:MAG: hypothetical protein AAGL23_00555 [Pseudomonadota bacterium]
MDDITGLIYVQPLPPTETSATPVPRQDAQMPRWFSAEQPQKKRRLNTVRIASPMRFFSRLLLFLGVLIPAMLGGYYYGVIASDQYETESRLVVRTIGLQTSENEGANRVTMLGGAAVVQDAHILVNYLKSVDIVKDLQADIDLRALFSRAAIDDLSRLDADASIEDLHRFWQRQTISYVDGPSGIIQFTVRAFSPEDAVLISQAAIDRAAGLIEKLSEQAKQDLLLRSEEELNKALQVYIRRLDDLRNLQDEAGILNPVTEAGVSTELIAELFLERLEAEAQLLTLQASGITGSPRIDQLRNRMTTLDDQIAVQRQQMAGLEQEAGELSAFFAQITELETERLLAESLYRSASRNYDLAKSTTQQQSTFVSVFAPPIEPSEPTHPRRFALWVLLVSCCWAAWATIVLVWAAIEDHRS